MVFTEDPSGPLPTPGTGSDPPASGTGPPVNTGANPLPLTYIADGASVQLPGGHTYHVVMDVAIGRTPTGVALDLLTGGNVNSQVLWRRTFGAYIKVPAGATLYLTNSRAAFADTFKAQGILGISNLGGTNLVAATLGYNVDSPDAAGFPDQSALFGNGIADSLRSQMQNGSALKGEWAIVHNGAAWQLTWPNVVGPNLFSFFTGDPNLAGDPFTALRNFFASIAQWVVTWGPWILLGLAIVLVFLFAPWLILALIKAAQGWTAVAALL